MGDQEIAFAACARHYGNLTLVGPDIKNDKGFALRMISHWRQFRRECAVVLEFAAQAFAEDEEFVLEAVRRNAHVLGYTSELLIRSKDFILSAVANGGYTLCHVP